MRLTSLQQQPDFSSFSSALQVKNRSATPPLSRTHTCGRNCSLSATSNPPSTLAASGCTEDCSTPASCGFSPGARSLGPSIMAVSPHSSFPLPFHDACSKHWILRRVWNLSQLWSFLRQRWKDASFWRCVITLPQEARKWLGRLLINATHFSWPKRDQLSITGRQGFEREAIRRLFSPRHAIFVLHSSFSPDNDRHCHAFYSLETSVIAQVMRLFSVSTFLGTSIELREVTSRPTL